jgi:hypothetical protein
MYESLFTREGQDEQFREQRGSRYYVRDMGASEYIYDHTDEKYNREYTMGRNTGKYDKRRHTTATTCSIMGGETRHCGRAIPDLQVRNQNLIVE